MILLIVPFFQGIYVCMCEWMDGWVSHPSPRECDPVMRHECVSRGKGHDREAILDA